MLRLVLCGQREIWISFDEVFDAYWLSNADEINKQKLTSSENPSKRKGSRGLVGFSTGAANGDSAGGSAIIGGGGTSRGFGKTDLRFLLNRESYSCAARLAEAIARRANKRYTRRWKSSKRGRIIEARATLRHLARKGDETSRLFWKQRKEETRLFVMILDV